jgi:ParB family chromosome partitioning protein
MSKVSARSAETILALSKKSITHKEALIEIAEEIRKGAGSVRIEKLVNEILNGEFGKEEEEIITNTSGQVLAKWKDGKLYFAKDLKLDKNKFNKMLVDFFNIENK